MNILCDHTPYHLWSQHNPVYTRMHIHLLWLTLSFSWSVCFCVYTYHPTPSGACRPLSTQAWSRIMQRHDPCWKRYDTIHPPPYQRYVCFQQVTCLRQLLLHQLPLLVVIKWGGFYTEGVNWMTMYKIPLPPIEDGWCMWSYEPWGKSLVRCRT